MKQYQIRYLAPSGKWPLLEPYVARNIYDTREVAAAVALMRALSCLKGIVVQSGSRLFNIVTFDQEAEAPRSFSFEKEYFSDFDPTPDDVPITVGIDTGNQAEIEPVIESDSDTVILEENVQ